MNPRALAIWSGITMVLALVSTNPIDRALILLVAINVTVSVCRPDRSLRGLTIMAITVSLGAVFVNALEAHSGSHRLASIPDGIPLVGGPITLEAVAWGGATALGICAALVAVAPLALGLDPHQLITALPRAMDRTATALATSLVLIPAFGRTAKAIRDAQRLRGWEPRGVRSWGAIVTPLVVGALESSVTVAESMEARGFGSSATRTHWSPEPVRRSDRAVVLTALAAAVIFGVGRSLGWSRDWLPFPDLIAPSISPVACVVAGLLLTPVVVWQRHASTA